MRNNFVTDKCFETTDKVADCPAFLALSLIANKWSIRILHALLTAENHTLRFSQIQKALDTITQRELTKQLREFERSGLVVRTIHPVVPPRVDYTLTAIGHSLWEPIGKLDEWATRYADTIQTHRAAFKDKNKI